MRALGIGSPGPDDWSDEEDVPEAVDEDPDVDMGDVEEARDLADRQAARLEALLAEDEEEPEDEEEEDDPDMPPLDPIAPVAPDDDDPLSELLARSPELFEDELLPAGGRNDLPRPRPPVMPLDYAPVDPIDALADDLEAAGFQLPPVPVAPPPPVGGHNDLAGPLAPIDEDSDEDEVQWHDADDGEPDPVVLHVQPEEPEEPEGGFDADEMRRELEAIIEAQQVEEIPEDEVAEARAAALSEAEMAPEGEERAGRLPVVRNTVYQAMTKDQVTQMFKNIRDRTGVPHVPRQRINNYVFFHDLDGAGVSVGQVRELMATGLYHLDVEHGTLYLAPEPLSVALG